MSLAEKLAEGRLSGLVALRDFLAQELEGAEGKPQVAAVVKQLRETLAEIEQLEKLVRKGSRVDDLKLRREGKSNPAGGGVAVGGGS